MQKIVTCVIIALVIISGIPVSFAQEIPITVTGTMDQVIFDGKWSFFTEWKATTLTVIDTQTPDPIYLRTAHQGNFVYVMIDATSDKHVTKNSDSAIVCFDTKNERKSTPNVNDYCFMVVLDGKSYTLQGGSPLAVDGNLATIPNPEGFIGIGSVSDNNDRYTLTPHASYEFKIPTSLIGRSDVYGFYVGIFDSHRAKMYSWPSVPSGNNLLHVPSPSSWGNLVSPDKSLPEFPWPVLALALSLGMITYMARRSAPFYR